MATVTIAGDAPAPMVLETSNRDQVAHERTCELDLELDLELQRWRDARTELRLFLQAFPRAAGGARITLAAIEDGRPVTLTRAELTAAIRRLHPRRRRVMEALERRIPRAQTCARLRISLKTYERDVEVAFDELVIRLVAGK